MKLILNLFLLIFMAVTVFSQISRTPEENHIRKVASLLASPLTNRYALRMYPTKEQIKSLAPAKEDLQKYSSFLSNNHTGILIAYRGKNLPQFPNYNPDGFADSDKRINIIIAFRVVKKDENGN